MKKIIVMLAMAQMAALIGSVALADGKCTLESNSGDFIYTGQMRMDRKVRSFGVEYKVTKAAADGGGAMNYELSPTSEESDTAPFWVTCGDDIVD